MGDETPFDSTVFSGFDYVKPAPQPPKRRGQSTRSQMARDQYESELKKNPDADPNVIRETYGLERIDDVDALERWIRADD